MSLFDKAIVITDLHLGKKNNSHRFNQDCIEFIDWVCDEAVKRKIKTLVFCGDWHDNRSSINVVTLNHSLAAFDKLSHTFDDIHFIPGNHDEYYRDNRNYNSIEFVKKYPNIHFYNEITTVDGATFVPWLIGDEYKKMRKLKSHFVFGHFELPSFYMNSKVQMPDNGSLRREDFADCDWVFTGHFHKRQEANNIIYIGNAFPHNYSDAWDDDRGMMILDWSGSKEYHAWPDAPSYKTLKLSELLDDPDKFMKPRSHLRVSLDIDVSYEEANFVKDSFYKQYDLRELVLIPSKLEDHDYYQEGEIEFESIDSIVHNEINQIASDVYDNNLLLEIYRHL